VHLPESNILCFKLRGSDDLNLKLRGELNRDGAGWITTTLLEGKRMLRITLMNPMTKNEDLARLLVGLAASVNRWGAMSLARLVRTDGSTADYRSGGCTTAAKVTATG
jgi:L-2,4-diaminobutyrate decarboxylase